MKMHTLEKDYSIKLSSKVVDYIYPDYIFIPIYDGYKLKVKNNEQVKKVQILLEGYTNIYSTISGKIVGAKECWLSSGERKKCIVIENDFKEKMFTRNTIRENLLQLTKTEFFNILDSKSIVDVNNTNELFINKFKDKNIKRIVLNGIEDEPYIATKLFELQNYTDEILEVIAFLSKIFKINQNLIVLKNNDSDNIEKYTNVLGIYPEISIKLVPDIYPLAADFILSKYLKCDINETLFLSPNELLNIFNLVKKNKITTEKYITITGNAIENPLIVNAKIGSLVKKIIDENIRFLNNDEVDYVINGLMTGIECNIDDLIVTNNLNGIIINYKKEYKEENCINCGKCFEVCPVGIDPKKTFLENCNHENACISCGLCTYICPVYINFKNRIKELSTNE